MSFELDWSIEFFLLRVNTFVLLALTAKKVFICWVIWYSNYFILLDSFSHSWDCDESQTNKHHTQENNSSPETKATTSLFYLNSTAISLVLFCFHHLMFFKQFPQLQCIPCRSYIFVIPHFKVKLSFINLIYLSFLPSSPCHFEFFLNIFDI